MEFFLGKELNERGINYGISCTLEDFENEFGKVSNYDGLLIHPGIEKQREFIIQVVERTDLPRWCFLSKGLNSRVYNGEIPIYNFTDLQGILKYFFPESF